MSVVEGVAALPEIVAVPGTNSRIMLGLAYIVGQIMTVVDIAPLFNRGATEHARQVLIVQADGEYYAIKADSVGSVITTASFSEKPSTHDEYSAGVLMIKDRSGIILNVPKLVQTICS
ncbi:MAG: hypothetical protein A3B30_02545 [Candidatus Komeilibacteria bacterium RIFCSPLOWO2_01_FULL_52_15]|uniref:CheW-like domain-containing protein n=1 Tax=Candidatus Komeilibacteria bacterium RIFCSPLOWO2_01_FULL_52_15 TaxID=1798551 RepID=A0A1G2BQI2_9BACT|nr:MAG: hypothetical protein A3B30_02545 [Candidatus Komeilibacteria bacterium RIFCSPLOWO2_01_FULL_52_15]